MPKWLSMPVSYWINQNGLSSQIQNGSEFFAVESAFQTWQNVPTADIHFNFSGVTSVGSVGLDGLNVVTFNDPTVPLGTTTIAATFSFYGSVIGSDGLIHFGIQEADIAFNPAFDFSTSGETGKMDIQGVITHEIGHFLGLDHAGMVSSVMVPFAVPSQLDQRTLDYDDIAGVMEIYPKNVPALGKIQGTVQSVTTPVFGAHVVAVDSSGTAVVSTLSQPDGTYVIRFVPAGTYRVYAEPLDNPVTRDNIGGGSAGFYGTTVTNFGTTYSGNVATLAAASTVNVAANGTATVNIQTLPSSSTGLNLTRPAFGMRLGRGINNVLTLGGEDITAGVSFSPSAPGIFLGIPSGACSTSIITNCFGGRISVVASTSAKMDISVPATTPLGPKNIAVSRNGDTSVLSGAVVITDPVPANISVAPVSGPVDGGTVVTVTGANFRAGAQVYFGGLPASSVQILNSGTIQAATPANAAGVMNVVVMNSDGTWGVGARAFSFLAAAPVITDASPLSGPAGTIVSIQGDHFGSVRQNVQVAFAGLPARVLSLANNSIQAVVPYGASSGAITVSVVGQTATGPTFVVSVSSPTTNNATSIYSFKDASSSSGGTQLIFQDPDDSVSSIPLPFAFTLFKDVFAAGERLSISINGWISLAGSSDRAFANSTLPAATVAQPTGGNGVVPPSLIAPFWDDLVLYPGTSSVSVRVIGTAPNRQLVIEWSKESIIDEGGNDQHANITFEAILFEGSNDIQFVYGDMAGPLSDGSHATVGMQDLSRTTAVLSSFNQPVVKSRTSMTFSYQNGGYVVATGVIDTTPPGKPVVTDEGAVTSSNSQLAASWISDAPPSGIASFQYAIGTTPGGSNVLPFTSTVQNSAIVKGLNLQANTTYYFAVKAISGGGVISDVGVSGGIRYDPNFQPQVKIIPSSPQSSTQFSGIALLAPQGSPVSFVLRAFDSTGAYVLGTGVQNPTRVSLAAGQQYAKLVSELFGTANFDGWIQVEASVPNTGVFTATGALDLSAMDGSVPRDLSKDFVVFHTGGSAVLVNPSPRVASVSVTSLNGGGVQTFTIAAGNRSVIPNLTSASRVQSSEALAAIEQVAAPGKLSINAAEPVSGAQSALVFPHAVVGGGYSSTLILTNVNTTPQNVTINFAGSSATARVDANGALRFPIPAASSISGAVRVIGSGSLTPSLLGVLDIDNGSDPVTIGARPAASEFWFPQVANGDGLFTGLALASGDVPANITVEVYPAPGGFPKSATVQLEHDQQSARLLGEIVNGVSTQVGGYIHIRSDQPIWAWEIYGSDRIQAAGPPL